MSEPTKPAKWLVTNSDDYLAFLNKVTSGSSDPAAGFPDVFSKSAAFAFGRALLSLDDSGNTFDPWEPETGYKPGNDDDEDESDILDLYVNEQGDFIKVPRYAPKSYPAVIVWPRDELSCEEVLFGFVYPSDFKEARRVQPAAKAKSDNDEFAELMSQVSIN